MKHTDFYSKIQAIKEQELIELKKAVKAHGGSYKWDDDNSRPIIAVNINNCCPNPQDVEIIKVAIVNNVLKIWGEDKEYGYPVDFNVHDVFAGHLSYIIESIPSIGETTDVSMYSENKPYIPQVDDDVEVFDIDRRYQKNDCSGKVIRIGKKYVYVRIGNYKDIRFDIATLNHSDNN